MSERAIPWSDILTAADAAVDFLPEPFETVAEIAILFARGYLERGCRIEGCPDDVRAALLGAADIPPVADGMFAARHAAARKAMGLKP